MKIYDKIKTNKPMEDTPMQSVDEIFIIHRFSRVACP